MFHVKHEGWSASAHSLGISLTDPQVRQLERYGSLLEDRALPRGLIAVSDAGRLSERHLVDSLRAATLVRPTDATAYDLGSGAGLPGIVVAIACPWLSIGLVESKTGRIAFLELAVRDIPVENAHVLAGRAEDLQEPVDLCFARAFGDVAKSWATAFRSLVPGGRLVYFAGEGFDPSSVPNDASVAIRSFPSLARSGPLVIMTRQ